MFFIAYTLFSVDRVVQLLYLMIIKVQEKRASTSGNFLSGNSEGGGENERGASGQANRHI